MKQQVCPVMVCSGIIRTCVCVSAVPVVISLCSKPVHSFV